MSFFVSAPGKVILFGEHSAVYGKPAIAAALSLRAYMLVSPSEDKDLITLDFPDINLHASWNRTDIPFEAIKLFVTVKDGKPTPTPELMPEIVDKLGSLLLDFHELQYTACLSFLYLYVHMCSAETDGRHFCVRSTVPIGAGLGSSACTSVCLATGLGLLGDCIAKPQFELHDKVDGSNDADLDFIDSWSFMGEKAFHGNPSGIDNAVATHGGAVMYQRMSNPAQPSVRTTMRNLPPLKLILTNTKVPRSTSNLVSNVSRVNNEYSTICGPILEAMGNISTAAYHVMMKPDFSDESKEKLKELVTINHGLLVALGVSHPSLEEIKMISDTEQLGTTKLTGAGGGGCAITLVNEGVSEQKIQQVLGQYKSKGFESYETALGGKGVGVLFDDSEALLLSSFKEFDREGIERVLSLDSNGWRFW